jgi:dihydroorotase
MTPTDSLTQILKIEGRNLVILPALIDPHVHFRVPGGEHKEDWKTAALACVSSGITTVCEMPNNFPPCTTYHRLEEKKELIEKQLKEIGIPLRYGLYFGADKDCLDQIPLSKEKSVGLKIFMGCSTGGLVIDDEKSLEDAFRLAKENQMLVAVHAEDEEILKKCRLKFPIGTDPSFHSKMRPRIAAIRATEKALHLCARYDAPLYILHLSTKEELELVRQAKQSGLKVFAEATTHHLFLSEEDYAAFGTFVQMNPPLRTKEDQEALWEGIRNGTIDTLGTDHAPHTREEKLLPFGQAPSGIPGVETFLPLMLDAVNSGKLTMRKLIELTRYNPERIFSLPPHDDIVLIDLDYEKEVKEQNLASKCGWTPYHGRNLKGWPIYTVLRGKVYASIQGTAEGKEQLEKYLHANRGADFEAY